MEWDVVVVGGANTDHCVFGERMPGPGETLAGDLYVEGPGGKGLNQAVAAARLGARVAFVGRVGADARGDALRTALRDEGVDLRYLVVDPRAPTGAAIVFVDSRGDKRILAAPGANRQLSLRDVRNAREALLSTRVLLFQLEVPLDPLEAAIRLAKEARARIVLDPAPARPIPGWLLASLDAIHPNADEAEVVTGIAVRDRASARAAAVRLRARGVRIAGVQAGDEGDVVLAEHEEIWLPRHDVTAVDATGAGDAFVAALAVGFAEGRPLRESARLASAAAALATTQRGALAGLPTRAELERFVTVGV